MNELPSTEFRKTFARLREPVTVTVNGHPIGTWYPYAHRETDTRDIDKTHLIRPGRPAGEPPVRTSQSQRDELLGKINRSKK
jgi:hypothetical protein